MKNEHIINELIEARLFDPGWFHWFGWHFSNTRPLARDIISTLGLIDSRAPGSAKKIAFRLGEIGGKERYEPHYEQLLQLLCELVVARRLCEVFGAADGYELVWEPVGNSKKNPEFLLRGPEYDLLVEVKCPSLLTHMRKANQNDVQLLARLGDPKIFDQLSDSGAATRPVDNRIKDFLVSAENKFASFDRTERTTFSLLVICWEQRMFEAVSPLINGSSGLLTNQSFNKDAAGEPIRFPNTDGIIVTPHLSWLIACTREEPCLGIYKSPLDYGTFGPGVPLPDPAFINNPHSTRGMPKKVIDALYGVVPDPSGDPMTAPQDMIFWQPLRARE